MERDGADAFGMAERTTTAGDGRPGWSPSRTTRVIDELLSRGSDGRPVNGDGGIIGAILRATPAPVLEVHLTWLAAHGARQDLLAPTRSQVEDQARLLLRALDEAGADDAIARALEQGGTADGSVVTDDDLARYCAALTAPGAQRPDNGPAAALAVSAIIMADERRSAATPSLSSDPEPPSCPPSR
jgi:hypothetical protein